MALHKLSLCDLQKKFTAGEVTAVEIVRAYALRIGQVESKVKAYVTQIKDAALQHAAELGHAAEGMAQNQAIDGHAAGHQGQPLHRELCRPPAPHACCNISSPRTMRRSSPN